MIAFVHALQQKPIQTHKKHAPNNPPSSSPNIKKEFLQTHNRESAHFLFVFHFSMQNTLPVRPVPTYTQHPLGQYEQKIRGESVFAAQRRVHNLVHITYIKNIATSSLCARNLPPHLMRWLCTGVWCSSVV